MRTKDSKLYKPTAFASRYHFQQLDKIREETGISIGRLICIAIDNELMKEEPFKLDTEIPDVEHVEFAFADQAGKIIEYMKTLRSPIGLDMLLLLRHDIGIPERETFLLAFKECLTVRLIEPKEHKNDRYRPDYVMYGLKKEDVVKKVRKQASEYDRYLRLKRKYENEA